MSAICQLVDISWTVTGREKGPRGEPLPAHPHAVSKGASACQRTQGVDSAEREHHRYRDVALDTSNVRFREVGLIAAQPSETSTSLMHRGSIFPQFLVRPIKFPHNVVDDVPSLKIIAQYIPSIGLDFERYRDWVVPVNFQCCLDCWPYGPERSEVIQKNWNMKMRTPARARPGVAFGKGVRQIEKSGQRFTSPLDGLVWINRIVEPSQDRNDIARHFGNAYRGGGLQLHHGYTGSLQRAQRTRKGISKQTPFAARLWRATVILPGCRGCWASREAKVYRRIREIGVSRHVRLD
jgi:hypothetical protein